LDECRGFLQEREKEDAQRMQDGWHKDANDDEHDGEPYRLAHGFGAGLQFEIARPATKAMWWWPFSCGKVRRRRRYAVGMRNLLQEKGFL
jgi:hypothetical protein